MSRVRRRRCGFLLDIGFLSPLGSMDRVVLLDERRLLWQLVMKELFFEHLILMTVLRLGGGVAAFLPEIMGIRRGRLSIHRGEVAKVIEIVVVPHEG
jgi:hypothetical protein